MNQRYYLHLVLLTLNLYAQSINLVIGYPQDKKDERISAEPLVVDEDADMYMESTTNEEQPKPASQNFIPSFAPFHNPPLGHSRPYYYQQEAAYSHRPTTSYQQHVANGYDPTSANRFSGYKGNNNIFNAHSSGTEGILGSGNFGVLKGGTFYNDAEPSNYDNFNPFYQNGHGRPDYYFGDNPPPQQQREQFANFRDFADINTPSYSNFVIVYANKNGTQVKETMEKQEENDNGYHPKNIIEHLEMLDMESSTTTTTTETVPTKKLSKSKRKLAKVAPEKKQRKKTADGTKDLYEPLLALS